VQRFLFSFSLFATLFHGVIMIMFHFRNSVGTYLPIASFENQLSAKLNVAISGLTLLDLGLPWLSGDQHQEPLHSNLPVLHASKQVDSQGFKPSTVPRSSFTIQTHWMVVLMYPRP